MCSHCVQVTYRRPRRSQWALMTREPQKTLNTLFALFAVRTLVALKVIFNNQFNNQ